MQRLGELFAETVKAIREEKPVPPQLTGWLLFSILVIFFIVIQVLLATAKGGMVNFRFTVTTTIPNSSYYSQKKKRTITVIYRTKGKTKLNELSHVVELNIRSFCTICSFLCVLRVP
jgi:hypothetical protein